MGIVWATVFLRLQDAASLLCVEDIYLAAGVLVLCFSIPSSLLWCLLALRTEVVLYCIVFQSGTGHATVTYHPCLVSCASL